ncbi:periplasmic cysteine-binding protein [Campylobacter blaseri]|uniref:Solute-binding protein family 3/N-terminal domain-containing protein n=1 Tax=Campylobacter blaseri TaxID=2042961 RepID=A0A2P8R242_9BACT|nr:transporter substrate-binding domain-containing protein [Campylobacter blaseri]PSM52563.1 hypothetical protein CQ405_02210 [Campylobacter blaseri]PSM54211.1 hypothetical protein CRN67_02210 [Campylobacter blaseri]QKF85862.1 periplasmic cysteine-binding protein [Campylobacter blaseri]
MIKKIYLIFCILVISLSANSYQEIIDSKTIRIGVSKYMPPFSKLQDDGTFEGFEITFAKNLIQRMFNENMNIVFTAVEQSERIDVLENNKVDMVIAAFTRNDEREKHVDFSIPYFSINLSMVTPKKLNIKNIGDLQGKNILTIKNTNSDVYLQKQGKFNIVYCIDNGDCYKKMRNGEGDAFMHNIVSTATIPLLDSNYEVSIGAIGESFFDCVTIQKGNTQLLNKVNEVIISLAKEDFFSNSYNETFKPFYRGSVDKKYFILDDIYKMMF